MLNKRQRLRWFLREARLPRDRRIAARAERWEEMAKFPDQRRQGIADHEVVDGEAHHSRGADFHRN